MSDASSEFERQHAVAGFSDQDLFASAGGPASGKDAAGLGTVVSAQWRTLGPPNPAFALAFATRGGGRVGPFLLTPRVAAEIRKALVDSGF